MKAGVLAAKRLTRAGLSVDWWAVKRAADSDDPAVRRVVEALVKWCSRAD